MSRSDRAVLAGAGVALAAVVVAFVADWVMCRARKGWYLEPGQPDECIPSAIRAGLKAGIFHALKVPPVVQFGVGALERRANMPTRPPDLIDDYGQPIWLRLPEDPWGEPERWWPS